MTGLAMTGLTMGPLLFHWPRAKRRDFYFRIADEAPIDCVHLGEVVCSRREPFAAPDIALIADRLRAADKQVVLSTLALVTSPREVQAIRNACAAGFLIEANDVSALQVLQGQPHVAGPLLNILNEASLAFVARGGAIRIVPPVEVSLAGLAVLAAHAGAVEIEAQVFGRQTLSVSARCYHARAHGLHQDGCRFVCEDDPDGLAVDTLDGRTILSVNGTQTMSHGYVVLLHEMAGLAAAGVRRFRLSPQDVDMAAVARLVRATLDGAIDAEAAMARLQPLIGAVPMVNGYLHGREGLAWVARSA
jgi:collagenase-like PrtC family protease